jgi:hypothetical protein
MVEDNYLVASVVYLYYLIIGVLYCKHYQRNKSKIKLFELHHVGHKSYIRTTCLFRTKKKPWFQ